MVSLPVRVTPDTAAAASDLTAAATSLASARDPLPEPPLITSGSLTAIQAAAPAEVAARQHELAMLQGAVTASATVTSNSRLALSTVLSGDSAALAAIASAIRADTTSQAAASDVEKLTLNLRIFGLAQVQTRLVLANDAQAAAGSELSADMARLETTPSPAQRPLLAEASRSLASLNPPGSLDQQVEALDPAAWLNAPQAFAAAINATASNQMALASALRAIEQAEAAG